MDRYGPNAIVPRYIDPPKIDQGQIDIAHNHSAQPALLDTFSIPMRHVLDRALSISKSDGTALITGDGGTCKGVIAIFIHEQSTRRCSPFVSVNCAGLPEGVLESELFGHERGAFTGAVRQRIGRFEQAHDLPR